MNRKAFIISKPIGEKEEFFKNTFQPKEKKKAGKSENIRKVGKCKVQNQMIK